MFLQFKFHHYFFYDLQHNLKALFLMFDVLYFLYDIFIELLESMCLIAIIVSSNETSLLSTSISVILILSPCIHFSLYCSILLSSYSPIASSVEETRNHASNSSIKMFACGCLVEEILIMSVEHTHIKAWLL